MEVGVNGKLGQLARKRVEMDIICAAGSATIPLLQMEVALVTANRPNKESVLKEIVLPMVIS